MQQDFEAAAPKIVLLGTGGTIAGWAADATRQGDYQAGVLSTAALLADLKPPLAGSVSIALDEFAHINSKDASSDFWLALRSRLAAHLAQASTAAVVVTHGTDTLEETCFFLSHTLPHSTKPLIFTCAMRPASHPQPDGPQNLRDALLLAQQPQAAGRGALVVCGGEVHAGSALEKVHSSSLRPFISRNGLPLGLIRNNQLIWSKNDDQNSQKMPSNLPEQLLNLMHSVQTQQLPRVEIIHSHAGASGALVDALLTASTAPPLAGIVVAGTGQGTIHQALEQALLAAQQQGVRVVRASSCQGLVHQALHDPFIVYPQLSPKQARIQCMLDLLSAA